MIILSKATDPNRVTLDKPFFVDFIAIRNGRERGWNDAIETGVAMLPALEREGWLFGAQSDIAYAISTDLENNRIDAMPYALRLTRTKSN